MQEVWEGERMIDLSDKTPDQLRAILADPGLPPKYKRAAREALGQDEPSTRPTSHHDSQWEHEYHAYLDALKRAGEIRGYRWKDFRVRLVRQDGERDRYYSPEALVWLPDGTMEVHEVKGRKREAGMMRFDLAREQWPCFRWRMMAKRDGRWVQIRGDDGHE